MNKRISKAQKVSHTIIELLFVLVILGVTARLVAPRVKKAITRSQFTEVGALVDLIASSARYYDIKHGLGTIDWTGAPLDPNDVLDITLPSSTECQYTLIPLCGTYDDTTAGVGKLPNSPGLRIYHEGTLLYVYNFESGHGFRNVGHAMVDYLPPDLP